MATVAKGTVVSLAGITYDIFLDNGAPTEAGRDFNIRSAAIDYKSETDDIDAHLLTSKATVSFSVRDANDKAIFTPLVTAQELQYRLRIEREGELLWVGFVLLDLVEYDFSGYPYDFTISATDGISRLKSLEYKQGDQDAQITLKDHLYNIFSEIPLTDYYGASDVYMAYHSTLVPEGMTPGNQRPENLRYNFKALQTVDQRGEVKYQTYYTALLEFLKSLNLRLTYSGGRYVITEIADYARQNQQVLFYQYDKDGGALTDLSLTGWNDYMQEIGPALATDDAVALARGTGTYLPPLRAVELTYKNYTRQNLIPGYTSTFDNSDPLRIVENFGTSGGNGTLRITGLLSGTYAPDIDDLPGTFPTNEVVFVRVRVRVEIVNDEGTSGKMLNRGVTITSTGFTYQPAEWVDYVSGGGNAWAVMTIQPRNVADGGSAAFQIDTPPVPIEGTLRFSIASHSVFVGGSQNLPDAVDMSLESVFMESLLTGSIEDQYNYTLFSPNTESTATNSVVLERDHVFGDGPGSNTFGRIEWYDGSSWSLTDEWRRHAAGAYLTTTPQLNGAMIARMTLAMQDNIREVLDIEIIGKDYYAEYLLKSGTTLYVMQSGQLNLSNDQWRGRWFQMAVNYDDTTTENQNFVDNPGSGYNPTGIDTAPPDPPLPSIDPNFTPVSPGLAQTGLNSVSNDIETGFNSGDTVDSIEVGTDTDSVPVFAGDVVLITDPSTGVTQEVVIAYDGGLGVPADDQISPPGNAVPYYGENGLVWMVPSTTDVAVDSFTAGVDISDGSYLQPNPQFTAQLNALLRKEYLTAEVFGYDDDLTTGFASWFWRPALRLGWRILNVHFAFAQDMTGSAKVNLKYYDATGYRYTIATHNAGGLGSVQAAFATVQEGYYRIEVETVTGTAPKGLTVTIETIKRL